VSVAQSANALDLLRLRGGIIMKNETSFIITTPFECFTAGSWWFHKQSLVNPHVKTITARSEPELKNVD